MTYAVPRPRPAGELRDEPVEQLEEELRAAARLREGAPGLGRARRCPALRGVDSAALTALAAEESDNRVSTVLHRLRRSDRSTNSSRRGSSPQIRHRPSRADAATGRGHAPAPPGRGVRRAAGRLVGAPDVPGLGAGLAPCQGGAVRRGRRRALRGLPHLRRRSSRAPAQPPGQAGPPGRRTPAELGSAGQLRLQGQAFVGGAGLSPLERHHAWKEIFGEEARAELLRRRAPNPDPLAVWRERFAQTDGAETLARLQDVDLGIYLVDDLLVKTDRASMANSLETRVPFLDTEVSELALGLPTSAKVRGLRKKVLLRRAVAPLVPREIDAGKKQGFSIPAAAWLRGGARAVRARGPVAGERASPGLPRSRGGHEGPRSPRLAPRGSLSAAVGTDLLHPVVRAVGRRGEGAAGGARNLG